MDQQQFDRLARLAATSSRRQVIRSLAGAAGGGLLALIGAGQTTAQSGNCFLGTCNGCCDRNRCRPGRTRTACGFDGRTCQACAEGTGCINGACGRCNDQTCPDGCCTVDGDCCDDHNPCTVSVCDGTGGCQHLAFSIGTPCDDGNACTTGATCQADGTCGGGVPIVCPTCQRCNRRTGACDIDPVANNRPCDDGGDLCEINKRCVRAVCRGTPRRCPQCQRCDPATGNCAVDSTAVGRPCNDFNACTVGERCQADGTCGGGTPTNCPVCQKCSPNLGCVPDPTTANQPCDDGTPCRVGKRCRTGQCIGGSVAPSGTKCDDGDLCTASDTCSSVGACLGAPIDCGVCHHCDQTTGACVIDPAGVPCDDGNPCTTDTTCVEGECRGQAMECPTCQTCDGVTGACTSDPTQNSGACDDGDACTDGDACQNGLCAGIPKECGACQTCAAGECLPDSTLNGAPCSDGNPCTPVDFCQDGACLGGTQVECPICQACSTADGSCEPSGDGTACGPGSECTDADVCQGGTCVAGAPRPDGTPCNSGSGACSGGVCVASCDGTSCGECRICDPTNGCVPDLSQQFCAGFTGQCVGGSCRICAETCSGCCSGPFCEANPPASLCFVPGGECRSCDPAQTCNNGTCDPPCATFCIGCCSGEFCVRTPSFSCGTGGEQCFFCPSGNCVDGRCE